MLYTSFGDAIDEISADMKALAKLVHTEKWQGVPIADKPEMATHELQHVFLQVPLHGGAEVLPDYQAQIKPNLPWADNHFLARVCGQPINPGVEWANWPYAHSARNFLDENGKFNHNYMERYWSKWAGLPCATRTPEEYKRAVEDKAVGDEMFINRGIYHKFGDLNDVINQLLREPQTRQAILPVFFPEDTGAVHGGRVPCSMYYQFLVRNRRMDIVYAIRSCDFVRHFRDDIYLTVRLLLWMLDQLRARNSEWRGIRPGRFVMMITSLHMFRNDYLQMWGRKPDGATP